MVNKEQLIKGVLLYADKEVMPHLPTVGKWGLGSIILLAQNKATNILDQLSINPFVMSLGVINCDGMIDIDLLSNALIQTANKYGKVELTIPMIGSMSFSARDVELLKTYVIGGIDYE